MKDRIYITGHRNPDLDSLCSALAYAELKNRTDPDHEYIAVRCGEMSESVEKQMVMAGVNAPPLKQDVFTKVCDVMLEADEKADVSDPVYDLVRTYSDSNPSVTPLFDKGRYAGLLSVDDVTRWFLKENTLDDPRYDFTVENIDKVLPGKILHRGNRDSFTASITIGAASFNAFSSFLARSSDSLVVLGARPEHIKFAISKNVPAVIITTRDMEEGSGQESNVLPAIKIKGSSEAESEFFPEIDCGGYEGLIYATPLGTSEAIRRLRMSEPLGMLMGKEEEPLSVQDLFTDAKDMLSSSRRRGLAVMDSGEFKGFVTRRCFLDMPKHKVIMVDHNEAGQSIKGIETADIAEIVDHHRLDAMKTELPILVDARPLGSTCTIVWQRYLAEGIVPGEEVLRALLAGLMSDTLILKSPTTTEIDRKTAEGLAKLIGTDYREFGRKLFSVTGDLASADPERAIFSDFKKYESGGIKIGIGQCETTTLGNQGEYAPGFLDALERIKASEKLDWAMLMITDVLSERSILLCTCSKNAVKLPYEKITEYNDPSLPGTKGIRAFDMPGVMSRKKQLLPAVLRAVEQ